MKETVNIRIPVKARDDLKIYAKENGVTLGAAILLLLARELPSGFADLSEQDKREWRLKRIGK